MVVGLDKDAEIALYESGQALEEVSIEVIIEPGILVLLDNHFIFHGRNAFEPQFDDDGRPYRWLQRVFWTSSMRRFGWWERTSDHVVCPCI